MQALIRFQGKQHLVKSGQRLVVDRVDAEVGAKVSGIEVALTQEGETVRVGAPTVGDAIVTATVLEHQRGPKLRISTYQKRKRTRRVMGHRQEQTVLQIDTIS